MTFRDIHRRNAHVQRGADPQHLLCAAADQGPPFAVEVVGVVGQAGEAHQAVDQQVRVLDEHAELLDAGDDAREGVADASLEVFEEFDLRQFPLGGLGPAFGAGAVGGGLLEGRLGEFRRAGLGAAVAPVFAAAPGVAGAREQRLDRPVHRQVGVPADGRGEMAVGVGPEGVVPQPFDPVLGLLEAPEDGQVDAVRLGLAAHAVQEPLKFPPVGRVAQALADAGGEVLEFLGGLVVGLGVDAAHARDAGAVEFAGHGLVGLDHEHLDNAMGETGVLGMGGHHAALVVELEVHLRQVEFQVPEAPAALEQPAGQGVHAPQEVQDARVQPAGLPVQGVLGLAVRQPPRAADKRVT